MEFRLEEHLERQYEWSKKTFGPGARRHGLVNHIKKELDEVLLDPDDLSEWVDIIILACDGALREGFTPDEIVRGLVEKQRINEERKWPDWRNFHEGEAIEHIRESDRKVS